MIMYDGTPERARDLGEQLGLTFPILSDPNYEVFGRWDESNVTPSSTIIDRGSEVAIIDTTWYPAQLEELIYGPPEED